MRALRYLIPLFLHSAIASAETIELQHLNTAAQDEDNFLYLSSHNGVYRYDGEHSVNLSQLTNLPKGLVKEVHTTEDSKYMVVHYQSGELWRLDLADLSAQSMGIFDAYKLALLGNQLYILDRTQLTKLDLITASSEPVISNKEQLFDIDAGFGSLYALASDGVYVVSELGARQIDYDTIDKGEVEATPHGVVYTKNSALFYYSLAQGSATTSADIVDAENLTYLAPYYLYYTNASQVNEVNLSTLEISRHNIANSKRTYVDLFSDKKDILWGLTMNNFMRIDGQNKITDINLGSEYNSIEYVNGKIWIGTSKGVFEYADNTVKGVQWLNALLPQRNFDVTAFRTFAGNLVLSTSLGAFKINTVDKTLTQLTDEYVINLSIVSGKLALATNDSGVVFFDQDFNRVDAKKINNLLPTKEVLNIDQFDGLTYVSTAKGLMAFDAAFHGVLEFNKDVIVTDVELLDGDVYLSTYGKGLFVRNESEWVAVPSPSFIVELSQFNKKLFLHTNNGLHRLTSGDDYTTPIQGTLDHSFSTSSMRYVGSKLVAVSDRGMLTIYNHEEIAPSVPRVVFTDSELGFSQTIPEQELKEDWLHIAISSFDFYSERKGTYEYRLNSGHWKVMSSAMLQLSGLKETNHTVEFRYVKGNRVSEVMEVNFSVAAAWYTSTLVIAAVIGLLIAIIGTVFYMAYSWVQSFHRVYRKNQTQYQESKVTEAMVKLTTARTLCGGDDTMLSEGLVKFDTAITDLEPIVHNSASLGPNSLSSGLNLLQIQASMQAAVDVKFRVTIGDAKLDPQLERDIYSVMYHGVKNSIEHSGASKVNASLLIQRDGLEVCIEDDGHGIPLKSRFSFGTGFYSMRRVAKAYSTKLRIKTSRKGTLILIKFPHIEPERPTKEEIQRDMLAKM